jgi:hypothetical protein
VVELFEHGLKKLVCSLSNWGTLVFQDLEWTKVNLTGELWLDFGLWDTKLFKSMSMIFKSSWNIVDDSG